MGESDQRGFGGNVSFVHDTTLPYVPRPLSYSCEIDFAVGLACGGKKRQTPFQRLSEKQSDFILAKYLPPDVTLQSPRAMHREVMVKVFKHIAAREASHGVKDAFRFRAVLSSRKQGTLGPACYFDSKLEGVRPAPAVTKTNPKRQRGGKHRTSHNAREDPVAIDRQPAQQFPAVSTPASFAPALSSVDVGPAHTFSAQTATLVYDRAFTIGRPVDLDPELDPDIHLELGPVSDVNTGLFSIAGNVINQTGTLLNTLLGPDGHSFDTTYAPSGQRTEQQLRPGADSPAPALTPRPADALGWAPALTPRPACALGWAPALSPAMVPGDHTSILSNTQLGPDGHPFDSEPRTQQPQPPGGESPAPALATRPAWALGWAPAVGPAPSPALGSVQGVTPSIARSTVRVPDRPVPSTSNGESMLCQQVAQAHALKTAVLPAVVPAAAPAPVTTTRAALQSEIALLHTDSANTPAPALDQPGLHRERRVSQRLRKAPAVATAQRPAEGATGNQLAPPTNQMEPRRKSQNSQRLAIEEAKKYGAVGKRRRQ